MSRLTPEEKKEFSELKHTLCDRGFLVPNEKLRYNELFDKQAKAVISALNKVEQQARQEDLN